MKLLDKVRSFFAALNGAWFDKRLWASIGTVRSTTAKVDVSEETALNYAAVWCATRLLCGTGASLPLPVYRSEDGETREKLKNHTVHRLLNIAPNVEMTAFNFRSVMWQWQVNWGNAFAEIVREGKNPDAPIMALWPLHPTRVKVCRDENNQLYYEVQEPGGRPPIELEPWQVLHLPSVITYDGVVGRGVIQHARETIGAGIAAEKKAANRFGDGGIPSIVVEHPGMWNKETRDSFRKEWKEIYGGPDGDNVAVLQGGATAKPLQGFSEKDSQFLESRMFDVEDIARWYGIPPHLLHHLLRATFNNVEELGIDFVRYCLVPWLEIWEQSVRMKLFTEAERDELFVEHNADALMRGNAAARSEFYRAMTSAAVMNRNECRKLENLDPVDGGDVFLVQGAMVPLDSDGKPESEFVAGSEPPSGEEPKERKIAASIERVIERDLSRMLTKETKAMESYAQRPQGFVGRVDEFYAAHRDMVVDVLDDPIFGLGALGHNYDLMKIAAEWVREGKSLILEAAGSATNGELPVAVKRVLESRTWTERPAKALERANGHATLVV